MGNQPATAGLEPPESEPDCVLTEPTRPDDSESLLAGVEVFSGDVAIPEEDSKVCAFKRP
jgi:hypothetical protein